jgi:hypothetical protein
MNIGAAIAGEIAAVIVANKQAIQDKVVALGDAGLVAIDTAVKAADHIPVISAIINGAADKLVAQEEAALPEQVSAAIDGLVKLLQRDAGQIV